MLSLQLYKIIEEDAKLIYSLLRKGFKKQRKTIEKQGKTS